MDALEEIFSKFQNAFKWKIKITCFDILACVCEQINLEEYILCKEIKLVLLCFSTSFSSN